MDVEIEQPHLAHEHLMHQHPTRHWTDYAIPVSALFVSLISILIAWQHGEVMQQLVAQNAKLVRANSMPYLELGNSNVDPNGEPHMYLSVVNRGVGPAQIRTVQIYYNGQPVGTLRQLIKACCYSPKATVFDSTLQGRMLQAGQEVRYIDIRVRPQSKPLADALFKAYVEQRMTTNLCYCSLFDECWKVSSASLSATPVRECPPVKLMYSS